MVLLWLARDVDDELICLWRRERERDVYQKSFVFAISRKPRLASCHDFWMKTYICTQNGSLSDMSMSLLRSMFARLFTVMRIVHMCKECECICVHVRVYVSGLRLNLAPYWPSLLSLWALLKFQPDLLLREGSLLSHMAVRIHTGRLFSLHLTLTQQARVFFMFRTTGLIPHFQPEASLQRKATWTRTRYGTTRITFMEVTGNGWRWYGASRLDCLGLLEEGQYGGDTSALEPDQLYQLY